MKGSVEVSAGQPPAVSRRQFVSGVAAILGVEVGMPAVLNLPSTARVAGWLLGGQLACPAQSMSAHPGGPFDAIVIPGSGSEMGPDGVTPDWSSRVRLTAGAIAYADGQAPRFVLLEGRTKEGEDPKMSQRFICRTLGKISTRETPGDDAFIRDDGSINTATNMLALRKIAARGGFHEVLLVTSRYQAARAVAFACNLSGVSVVSRDAESIIIARFPQTEPRFSRVYATRAMQLIQWKEAAETLLTPLDPVGTWPTLLRVLVGS